MIKTNRSLGNFLEYGLKGDFTSFNLPNAFSTSFSPYIHQNFPFALQSRVNPHFHSHKVGNEVRLTLGSNVLKKSASHNKKPMYVGNPCDIHNEVLPLTLQSKIKQHQIISLIKGNCWKWIKTKKNLHIIVMTDTQMNLSLNGNFQTDIV